MLAKIVLGWSRVGVRAHWSLLASCLAVLALSAGTQQARSQSVPGTGKSDQKSENKPAVTEKKLTGIGGPMIGPKPPSPSISRPALPPMAPPSVEYFPQPAGTEKRILAVLEEPGEFNFTNESLEKILAILGEYHEIPFEIDRLHLGEESIKTDEKEITLKLSGISLRSALKIVLNRKNLDFLVEHDFIRVTTQTEAINIRPTRTYPVRDLVGNVDADYELLSQTIQRTVGGPPDDPWMESDGEGGAVSAVPSTGCLVIRQTSQGHKDVLTLLRSLRKAKSGAAEVKGK